MIAGTAPEPDLPAPGPLPGRLLPAQMYPAGDARVRARRVALPDGLRVRAVESGPPDAKPVLFLHGWGASVYTFRKNLPAVGDAGWRAVAVDLPGHGLSDKPVMPGAYTLERLLAHVEAIIRALDLGRPPLVAQSMTGAIALELALRDDPPVSRIALLAPVGLGTVPAIPVARFFTPQPLDRVAPYLVPRWSFALALRMIYGDPRRVTSRDVDEYWAPTQYPAYARVIRALVHEFRWPPLAEARLAALRVPTLVVLGARDPVVRGARANAERLPGARVAMLPGTGHAVNEERPEEVNPLLVDFLAAPAAL